MWGDALLLAPILHPVDPTCGCSTRGVYLPKAADWVNFHTGVSTAGGDANVSFALNEAPLFARAGSIVVLGPLLQRTADASSTNPLEVRVYPGADATFALWEDDGVSRAYQGGDFTCVNIAWHEGPGVLTIGSQQGKQGQPARRSINVVFVRPGHGVGVVPVSQPDATVLYEGKAISVKKPGPRPVYMI
jgi:alpha-D-xyloside xylohydrolase